LVRGDATIGKHLVDNLLAGVRRLPLAKEFSLAAKKDLALTKKRFGGQLNVGLRHHAQAPAKLANWRRGAKNARTAGSM
jgi:hypothetical protein